MEYVGIDLHKKESQICIRAEDGHLGERGGFDAHSSQGPTHTLQPWQSRSHQGIAGLRPRTAERVACALAYAQGEVALA